MIGECQCVHCARDSKGSRCGSCWYRGLRKHSWLPKTGFAFLHSLGQLMT
jgi:hypothetical protein